MRRGLNVSSRCLPETGDTGRKGYPSPLTSCSYSLRRRGEVESKPTDNGRFIQVCVLVGPFTLCFFPLDDRVRWTPSPGKRNGQSRGDLGGRYFSGVPPNSWGREGVGSPQRDGQASSRRTSGQLAWSGLGSICQENTGNKIRHRTANTEIDRYFIDPVRETYDHL